jgi:hypothetical protein
MAELGETAGRCNFVKREWSDKPYCTACGATPEGILRNGPEACRAAASEASTKYGDRMDRGGQLREGTR